MKTLTLFFTVVSLMFPPQAFAGANCDSKKATADEKCDKTRATEYIKMKNLCQKGLDTHQFTGSIDDCLATKYPAALEKNNEYIKNCSQARNECDQSCQSDLTQDSQPMTGDPSAAQRDGKNSEHCMQGEPKENEDSAKKGNADMAQAMAALAALLASLGKKPSDAAQQAMCGTQASAPVATNDGTAPVAAGAQQYNPQLAQYCQTGNIDKSSKSDSDLADGTSRGLGADGEYLGGGDLQGGQVAPGTPAHVSLSSAMPGGGLGGGMGAGAAGASGSGRESGKKSDDSGGKVGLASSGGSGGGGGGSMAGSGGARTPTPGGPPGRSAVDGGDRVMQAALEKAAQQRGLASDGPAGGITGANSLDNFQKVEKRMQSERNNLNETK
jgi:hypothetical protein